MGQDRHLFLRDEHHFPARQTHHEEGLTPIEEIDRRFRAAMRSDGGLQVHFPLDDEAL
jgi:hypothetical protein